jgi:hypothetical protein
VPVRNSMSKDGLFKINDRRQVIYAKSDLSVAAQLRAANSLFGQCSQ